MHICIKALCFGQFWLTESAVSRSKDISVVDKHSLASCTTNVLSQQLLIISMLLHLCTRIRTRLLGPIIVIKLFASVCGEFCNCMWICVWWHEGYVASDSWRTLHLLFWHAAELTKLCGKKKDSQRLVWVWTDDSLFKLDNLATYLQIQ